MTSVLLICLGVTWLLMGCHRDGGDSPAVEVVVYVSVDEPVAAPILKRFERETGIRVRVVTDAEASKTTGLVEKLLAERASPRADVYWGNEIFRSINLADEGVLAAYRPTSADSVPARWRDADDLFTCVGLRARVLVRATGAQGPAQLNGLASLIDPSLKGKIAISHPGFGTASGHFAALYVAWGEEKYRAYVHGLRANKVKLLGGNSAVVAQVAAGNILAGLTDNDDVSNALTEGQAVEQVIPDQGAGDAGVLLIPGTVCLIKGAPHPDQAKRLIDFLCERSVEEELISAKFAAYSVRGDAPVRTMDVDYREVGGHLRRAVEIALSILQDRAE